MLGGHGSPLIIPASEGRDGIPRNKSLVERPCLNKEGGRAIQNDSSFNLRLPHACVHACARTHPQTHTHRHTHVQHIQICTQKRRRRKKKLDPDPLTQVLLGTAQRRETKRQVLIPTVITMTSQGWEDGLCPNGSSHTADTWAPGQVHKLLPPLPTLPRKLTSTKSSCTVQL